MLPLPAQRINRTRDPYFAAQLGRTRDPGASACFSDARAQNNWNAGAPQPFTLLIASDRMRL